MEQGARRPRAALSRGWLGQLAQALIHISLEGCQLALCRHLDPVGGAQGDEGAGVEGRHVCIGVDKHLQVLHLVRRGVACRDQPGWQAGRQAGRQAGGTERYAGVRRHVWCSPQQELVTLRLYAA